MGMMHSLQERDWDFLDPMRQGAAFTPPPIAINYRRSVDEMRLQIEEHLRQSQTKISLLSLLIQIKDVCDHFGGRAAPGEISAIYPSPATTSMRRQIRNLLADATKAGLLECGRDSGSFALLSPGLSYINKASDARLALWKINPRMDVQSICGIVASEELDYPLHYAPVVEKVTRTSSYGSKNKTCMRSGDGAHSAQVPPSHEALRSVMFGWAR